MQSILAYIDTPAARELVEQYGDRLECAETAYLFDLIAGYGQVQLLLGEIDLELIRLTQAVSECIAMRAIATRREPVADDRDRQV